jgi:hypothetical protein
MALPAGVPVGDLGGLPNGGRIVGYHRKVGQPLALYARSSFLPGATRRSWLVEGGIQPEAGDLRHRLVLNDRQRESSFREA